MKRAVATLAPTVWHVSLCDGGECLTFPAVAGVESTFLRSGPAADAEQPGQDNEGK